MHLWEKALPAYKRRCGFLIFFLVNLFAVLVLIEFFSQKLINQRILLPLSVLLVGVLILNVKYHLTTKHLVTKLTPLTTITLFSLLSLHFFFPNESIWDFSMFRLFTPALFVTSGAGLLAEPSIQHIKKTISPSLVLFLILSIGGVRLYNLQIPFFHGDEHETIAAAYSFSQTGDFYKWDWLLQKPGNETACLTTFNDCRYTRAWPYTITVAGSFKLFGVSEWSARLPGVLFSLGALLFVYLILVKLTNSKIPAVITVILLGFTPYFIETARFARMYSMLWFVFSVSIYAYILAYSQKKHLKRIALYVVGTLGMILSYVIHPVTLVMFPGLAIALLFFILKKYGKMKRYIGPLFACMMLGLVLIILNQTGYISLFSPKYLTVLDKPQFEYLPLVFRPFHTLIAGFIFVISGILAYKTKQLSAILPFVITGCVGLLFFIFFGGRYMHPHYISLITISLFMLIGINLSYLVMYTKQGMLVVLLCIGIVSFALLEQSKNIYAFDRNYGKYPIAYQSIIDTFNPGDVIIGQFLRMYYLQDPRLIDAKIIDMGRGKTFTLDDFKNGLTRYPSGFLVWDTLEENDNVDRAIRRYACANFTQLHGENCQIDVDTSKVEVFYFDSNKQ